MRKRYYLADIITINYGEGDEFATAASQYPVTAEAGFPVNPVTGRPLHNWALAAVTTNNHAQLVGDPRLDALPDRPLSDTVSSMDEAEKSGMMAAMQRRGMDTSSIAETDTYGDVLALIEAAVRAPFDENPFPV